MRTINLVIGQTQIERILVDLTTDGSERETLVGIKGILNVRVLAAGSLAMAIVKIPKGVAADALTITDNGEAFYSQFENVLWTYLDDFAAPAADDPSFTHHIMLDVKTKRKLRPGDKVSLLMDAENVSMAHVASVLSAFTLE